MTLLVVKDPLRLSHLDDLNRFIEAYEYDFLGKGEISEGQYHCALSERARFEGVQDEIILRIEEDGGNDLLECLHERDTYWKYVVEKILMHQIGTIQVGHLWMKTRSILEQPFHFKRNRS